MAHPPARRPRAVRWRRVAATLLAVVAVVAAVAAAAAAEHRRHRTVGLGPGPRTFVADAVMTPLDAPGLVAPVAIGRTRRGGFALDGATRRLVPVGPRSRGGTTAHDGPPPPWRRPALADNGHADDVVTVLDLGGAALHSLPSDGPPPPPRPLAGIAPAMAGCVLEDGSAVLLTEGIDDALASVAPDGRVRWRRRLPWVEVQARPPIARQGFAAVGPDRRSCVIALAFGPGWAWVDRHGAVRRMGTWRDRALPPAVRTVPGGTRLVGGGPVVHAIAVRGDTLDAVAAGPTGLALRTMDRIALTTGAYLGSVRLPRPVTAIVPSSDGWLALAVREGRAVPVTLRIAPRRVGFGGPGR